MLENGFDVVLALNSTLKKPLCKVNVPYLSKLLGIDVVQINAETGEGVDLLIEKTQIKSELKSLKKPTLGMIDDATERYEKIEKITKSCCQRTGEVYGKSKLDKMLLNRFVAPLIFLGIMGCIFYLTFFLIGQPLSSLLSSLLENTIGKWLNDLFSSALGSCHWLTLMIDEAVVGGIGTVLSFLPQIVLLFLFLSILEDSGYISRVAFVFDGLLSKIGLSGKSIYTLLLGFGCSASAILTARNMDDKKAKIKTILVTPFLSCSARLPIYLAIGGAFFGAKNIFVILFLYLLGLLVALLLSLILDKTILKSDRQSFILEFPPYRGVSLKRVLKVLYKNTKSFVFRIGSLLISMNIIVWLMSNFSFSFGFVGSLGGESMMQSVAKFISPIFIPLGFSSWKLVVALLVGVVAIEGVVSSMTLLFGGNLAEGLMLGSIFSSTASVFAFLTFCLLYVPCLSTIAVMRKEIGKKWTWISILLQTAVAYFVSMLVYNFSKLCEIVGLGKILFVSLGVLIVVYAVKRIIKTIKKSRCEGCKHCRK